MQAFSVPCWWVSWWLWRAGCISQDTYLLYASEYCQHIPSVHILTFTRGNRQTDIGQTHGIFSTITCNSSPRYRWAPAGRGERRGTTRGEGPRLALVQVFVVIALCEAFRTRVWMVLNFESMICISVVQCMFHTLDVFHLKDLQRSQGANKKDDNSWLGGTHQRPPSVAAWYELRCASWRLSGENVVARLPSPSTFYLSFLVHGPPSLCWPKWAY